MWPNSICWSWSWVWWAGDLLGETEPERTESYGDLWRPVFAERKSRPANLRPGSPEWFISESESLGVSGLSWVAGCLPVMIQGKCRCGEPLGSHGHCASSCGWAGVPALAVQPSAGPCRSPLQGGWGAVMFYCSILTVHVLEEELSD